MSPIRLAIAGPGRIARDQHMAANAGIERFIEDICTGASGVDLGPLQFVSGAFLPGRRSAAEPFGDRA